MRTANLGFSRWGSFELVRSLEMKVAMAKVRAEQADRDANVTGELFVRTALKFRRGSQPALDHLEPGAKPACDRACGIMKVCTKATNDR